MKILHATSLYLLITGVTSVVGLPTIGPVVGLATIARIESAYLTGRCLSVSSLEPANGTLARLCDCGASQIWVLNAASTPSVTPSMEIQLYLDSTFCLAGFTTNHGVNSSSEVAITKCEGIEPQTWSMRNNQIQLAMDPKACLTVLEDDFNHTLAISACNGGHNQSWNTIYS